VPVAAAIHRAVQTMPWPEAGDDEAGNQQTVGGLGVEAEGEDV
jgi:hypothetical protein